MFNKDWMFEKQKGQIFNASNFNMYVMPNLLFSGNYILCVT